MLFFWLLLADSTHLTAVWCTPPYFVTFLADSEIADAWKRRFFSQSGGPVLQEVAKVVGLPMIKGQGT